MRVGLVGCGRWGRLILRDLLALDCEVVVMTRNPESVDELHAAGAMAVVANVNDMRGIAAAVVAVPTVAHGDIVLHLTELGCPIFCEKPLTNDVGVARRIVDVAAERVFVMDKWRYHPGIHALRDIAQGRELGPVQGLKTVRIQWGHAHDDVDPAWTLLPHDLAIALEILGSLPTPVHAVAERDAEGLVALSAWLTGAAWLHCEVGIRSPVHVRSIELRCRNGVAILRDAYDRHIDVLRSDAGRRQGKPGEWERRPFIECMPLHAELAAFVAYAAGAGRPPRSSAAEGLRVVEIVAELRRLAGLVH
jgi:predicted dehydrogenase